MSLVYQQRICSISEHHLELLSITMAKKSLIRRAWKASGKDPKTLESLFESSTQPAIVHTDSMNAFELSDELSKTRQGGLLRMVN